MHHLTDRTNCGRFAQLVDHDVLHGPLSAICGPDPVVGLQATDQVDEAVAFGRGQTHRLRVPNRRDVSNVDRNAIPFSHLDHGGSLLRCGRNSRRASGSRYR